VRSSSHAGEEPPPDPGGRHRTSSAKVNGFPHDASSAHGWRRHPMRARRRDHARRIGSRVQMAGARRRPVVLLHGLTINGSLGGGAGAPRRSMPAHGALATHLRRSSAGCHPALARRRAVSRYARYPPWSGIPSGMSPWRVVPGPSLGAHPRRLLRALRARLREGPRRPTAEYVRGSWRGRHHRALVTGWVESVRQVANTRPARCLVRFAGRQAGQHRQTRAAAPTLSWSGA
jgi:hypothetical protein